MKNVVETARRMFRGIVGQNSAIYRVASDALNNAQIARREGVAMVATYNRLLTAKGGAPELLTLRSLKHPILVRPGSDDIPTIMNNVIREEYAQFLTAEAPRVMIDAGAFIGDTSAYFLSRYPSLHVIAVEPEAANIELAKVNLAPYGERVTLIQKALAGRTGVAAFGGQSIGGSLDKAGVMVETTTLPEILASIRGARIDILKMDIEGAELQVFESEPEAWLPHVDLIVAELHGPDITTAVQEILRSNGFGFRSHRSLTFFSRKWKGSEYGRFTV